MAYPAFGTGTWKVKIRVYRAAEDRWYDLDEPKSFWRRVWDKVKRIAP